MTPLRWCFIVLICVLSIHHRRLATSTCDKIGAATKEFVLRSDGIMSTERTTSLRRAPEPTDISLNPTARNRGQRRSTSSEPARCCSCTRHARCSRRRNTTCECRIAGRECVGICCPDGRCTNRPKVPQPGTSPANAPEVDANETQVPFSVGCCPSDRCNNRQKFLPGTPPINDSEEDEYDTQVPFSFSPPVEGSKDPKDDTPTRLPKNRHAESADDESTEPAPVRTSPAAQGDGRRSGIATDHTQVDSEPPYFFGDAGRNGGTPVEHDDDSLTGSVDGDILGTQATGASDDDNGDANEPGLPSDGIPDGGDEEETESDEPGGSARGRENVYVEVQDVEGDEDLRNQEYFACDKLLVEVYGDSIHRNDGRHMDGGVADDSVWQLRYDRVVAHPHPMYNPPKGGLGHRVVSTMAKEFTGVRERKWNSERPLIFAACILRKSHGVIRAADIRRRVERRLEMWTDGDYDALVQDIVGEAM